ncbi:Heterokaryon incompatibility protein 6- OR allele, partial [Apiospora kogelbergensis]|uniref:Heterokaryon incompatibility protein 6- OR allele n=1 Tax=Apiospora kogelbergensis TaxID=1337665 RepID=UPI0031310565
MARIYPQAVRNIIHLGEGAQKPLKTSGRLAKRSFPLQGLKAPVDENALSAFISLPWFNRVWFVQEVVLARNSICVLAGDELDFNVVGLVVTCRFVNLSVINFARSSTGSSAVWQFRDAPNPPAEGRGKPFDLNGCLLDTLTAQCTEARDKIFGVLGLYTPSTGPLSLLAVDYNKSYQNVYRDATRHGLVTTRFGRAGIDTLHTSIFRFITHSNLSDIHISDLPSWVLRYHEKADFEGEGHAL